MEFREASSKFVENYYIADLGERDSAESKWFLDWLKNIHGDQVLSLGCGPNLLDDAFYFGGLPNTLVGVDINRTNIDFIRESTHPELEKCRNYLKANQVAIEIQVADIFQKKTDFIGRFDAAYAMGVVGMYEPKRVSALLDIIASYIKPGGIFLDIDWTDNRLSEVTLKERRNFNWYDTQGPPIEDIGKLLTKSGFIVKRHEIYFVESPRDYGWGKIYAYLCLKT